MVCTAGAGASLPTALAVLVVVLLDVAAALVVALAPAAAPAPPPLPATAVVAAAADERGAPSRRTNSRGTWHKHRHTTRRCTTPHPASLVALLRLPPVSVSHFEYQYRIAFFEFLFTRAIASEVCAACVIARTSSFGVRVLLSNRAVAITLRRPTTTGVSLQR
jgi:hypothetical protein